MRKTETAPASGSRFEHAKKAGAIAIASLVMATGTGAANRSVEEVKQVTTKHGYLEINGNPLFPFMTWAQCSPEVDANISQLGINVFMDNSCGEAELADAVGSRAYLIAPEGSRVKSRYVIAENNTDEPDGYGIPPSRIPARKNNVVRAETFTADFANRDIQPGDGSPYHEYFAKNDFIGFDLYPINMRENHPWAGLSAVYSFQRTLGRLAHGKPTYQWIETNQLYPYMPAPSPQEVQAEIWLAIAGGAKGIGYFTHQEPVSANWRRYSVTPETANVISQTNYRIKRMAGILLKGAYLPPINERGNPVRVGAWDFEGKRFLLAVNSSEAATESTFGTSGLAGNMNPVGNPKRHFQVKYNRIHDSFQPFEAKWYVGKQPAVTTATNARLAKTP